METIYLGIVIFLFVLAIFDLVVGVSNDAVNFLQSAVGAKAASFKTILFIAGVGIFIGAALSNGMMDIARHGIYQPQHFYFAEIMCILLAVMLTDVVLLDVFNTMGMPTSTTVSMVHWHSSRSIIAIHSAWATSSIPTRHCLSSWVSSCPSLSPSSSVCWCNGWHVSCSPSTTRRK